MYSEDAHPRSKPGELPISQPVAVILMNSIGKHDQPLRISLGDDIEFAQAGDKVKVGVVAPGKYFGRVGIGIINSAFSYSKSNGGPMFVLHLNNITRP